jgi:hypothetical protein
VIGSEVDGNASFDATSGTRGCGLLLSAVCLGENTRFFGSVSITNTSPNAVVIAGNLFSRDLTCTGNAFVTNNAGIPQLMNTVLGQEFGQCVGL